MEHDIAEVARKEAMMEQVRAEVARLQGNLSQKLTLSSKMIIHNLNNNLSQMRC